MNRRLIGREPELLAVESCVDVRPAGAVLELTGEPGIGKTAVWREASERARRRGFRVLASRPGELETALAYSAVADLLEDVLDEALLTLAPARRSALERAVLRVEDAEKPPDPRTIGLALRDALRLVATEPLLVAIDDAQWLDASSASVLAYALRRLGDAPVSVLTTRRLGADGPPIELAVASETSTRVIRLAPLGGEAIEQLLWTRLGVSLPRPALREVLRASEGNPFFALELARAALQNGAVADGPLLVPRSLRDLLGDRIRGLSADIRDALLVVAAASQPTVALVEGALGSRCRALEVLSAAVAAEIIRVEDGRLRFEHPLMAEVVYSDAPREQRRRVHADLAGAVGDVEERAHHLALASELPDPAVARILDEAASSASARGAPSAAAGFAEHALRLTDPAEDDAVVRRTTLAADALWSAGETSRARVLLERLAAAMRPGAERALVLRHLARARAYEDGFVAATAPLAQALDEVGDDVRLRGALERDVALAIMNAGDVRVAAVHAESALSLARQLGDSELAEDARATNDAVRFFLGSGAPSDLAVRAHRLAREGEKMDRHPGFLARAQILASILKWSDDFSSARSVLEELRRRLEEREEEGPLVPVLFHLGELECWAGHLTRAGTIAAEAESLARRLGPTTTSQTLYLSGLVAAVRGEIEEAHAFATRGLALAEGRDARLVVRNLKVLGFLGLSLGDVEEADRRLARAAELAASHGFVDPGFFRLAADAIEARVAAGDVDGAEREASRLEALGRRLDRPWALALGARSRGLVAAARGHLADALSALDEALAVHARLPEPLERGRTLLALGSVRRQARRKRLAREALSEAVVVFEALPAPLWLERARREAARIGGRVPAGGALTETERRIAELVADGRSNAEVAKALVVSRKTVEWNLTNVYRKLGVRSRAELVRKAAESGP